MSVTIKEVEHIAELSKLNLTKDELEKFTIELNQILNYMEKLNELNTENVEPLSYPVEVKNELREDNLKKSISTLEALINSPNHNEKYFKVPKVIDR